MLKRIQYASCLYVDTFEKVVGAHFVKPVAPILVLNGNIGRLSSYQTQAFINHCGRLWQKVIYVPGVYELSEPCRTFSRSNIHFLNNSRVLINGVCFIGTPYISKEDIMWFHDQYISRLPDKKIVALSHGKPALSYVKGLNLDAWISGSTIGGSNRCFNGISVAYNGRGSICGPNDFQGTKGWRRDAAI